MIKHTVWWICGWDTIRSANPPKIANKLKSVYEVLFLLYETLLETLGRTLDNRALWGLPMLEKHRRKVYFIRHWVIRCPSRIAGDWMEKVQLRLYWICINFISRPKLFERNTAASEKGRKVKKWVGAACSLGFILVVVVVCCGNWADSRDATVIGSLFISRHWSWFQTCARPPIGEPSIALLSTTRQVWEAYPWRPRGPKVRKPGRSPLGEIDVAGCGSGWPNWLSMPGIWVHLIYWMFGAQNGRTCEVEISLCWVFKAGSGQWQVQFSSVLKLGVLWVILSP